MTPEKARVLIHAFIDGELDAASTIELEAQIDAAPALQQELARLTALQSSVQTHATRFNAPPRLTQRVFAAFPPPKTDTIPAGISPWWRSIAIGTTVTAMALLLWSLSSTFVRRDHRPALLDEVVSACPFSNGGSSDPISLRPSAILSSLGSPTDWTSPLRCTTSLAKAFHFSAVGWITLTESRQPQSYTSTGNISSMYLSGHRQKVTTVRFESRTTAVLIRQVSTPAE